MRQLITQTGETLSRLLNLDEPCGGRGMCGKCDVLLRSGTWTIEGRTCTVTSPRHALACQTRLASGTGEVDYQLRRSTIVCDWDCHPLPASAEPAIGIDIGTTTIAAVKACDGMLIARTTRPNSQGRFGDNVIDRIAYAATPHGMDELRQALLDDLNAVLDELGPAPVGIAANSTLSLILHGINPTPLGAAPFPLPTRDFLPRRGEDMGLHCEDLVFTAPLPGAFIGGDIAAGLSVLNLQPGDILADLGTNCEIVLRTAEGYLGSAAAAGPAFERTGNATASALVAFLADNVACGNLDRRGLPCPGRTPRLRDGSPIPPGQIAALVLAKAAIRAGIDTIAALAPQPPKRLVLAGGFAKFLDLNAARAIGMLPDLPVHKAGNTSLAGALAMAIRGTAPDCPPIQERFLDELPQFTDRFVDAMTLSKS